MRLARSSVAIVCALALTAACSGGDDDEAQSTPTTTIARASSTASIPAGASAPGASWETVTPAEVGLDAVTLEEIAAVAEEGKSNCLLVVRDGRIAGEWYFRDTNEGSAQEVFSASKSYASTLVGIAQDDGALDIDDSASMYIDEWRDTLAEAVTVRNLLSNDSGRQWSLALDYVDMIRAADRTAFAIALDQPDRPGTVWAYNNSAIQTLQRVVQEATGTEVTQFAQERLFGPLGMADTEMTTDNSGNALMFMGVHSTCRDMARFGLLMLNKGRWNDTQIVSEEWVDQATGAPSTELNAAYGLLWWLNHEGIVGNALTATNIEAASNPQTERGQLVPGAPEDTFWALGLGNQVIQIDPGTNTVVVRLGTGEAQPQPPTFGPADASRVVTEAVVAR
ncbi:MAG: serine hydrolase domain-containing protein [Actinomycetota bacterium]